MTNIQHQQASIKAAPWQQHQSRGDQHSPPPIHSSGLRHHLEPIQGVVKKSRSTDTPMNAFGERDVFGGQRKNQSAGDSRNKQKERLQSGDTTKSQGRLSFGDGKLKGHLGHLAAAVAESHRNASSGTIAEQSCVPEDTQTHDEVKNNLQPVDIDIYSCKNCDKMFCQQEEIAQHYLSCDKLS